MTKTVGLFDLDGTLLDSEVMRDRAHLDTILHFGGKGFPDGYVREIGKGKPIISKELIERTGISVSVEEYIKFYDAQVVVRSSEVELARGAKEVLEAMRERGVRMALVTAAGRTGMNALLDTAGIRSYFEVWINGDDVLRLKPDPEAYLLALEKMHVSPEDCFILEDSPSGVSAGVASGVKTVAIIRRHNKAFDLSLAHETVSETESTETLVDKLLE